MNSFLPKTFTKFLFIVMLFVGQIALGQTVVTHTFTATSGTIDSNLSFTTAQNSGTAAPVFNTGLRLYYQSSGGGNGGSITLLPLNGVTITNIEVTAKASQDPSMKYNVDGGGDVSAPLSSLVYTISGINALTSVKMRNANTTNKRMDLLSIKVTYTPAGPSIPSVSTTTASAIDMASASSGGNVTADGGASVTAKGVYYSTTTAPTSGTSDGTGTGTFTSSLTSLSLNTQYYYRAYATNSVGTGYGAEWNFYTLATTPGIVVVNNPQLTTLDVTVNTTTENSNPTGTEYAIQETGGQYVQANGSLGATAVWQTAATWATKTVTGLANSTAYTFQAKARNGANVETAFGATASATTLTPQTVDYNVVQFPNSTQTITEGTTFTVYTRAYEDGVTNLGGSSTRLKAWVGFSSTDDNPANVGWTWIAATFNTQVGNDDEYQANIPGSLAPGVYYYAARFELDDNGAFTYGGSGGNWSNNNVRLNVNADVVDFANIQSPTTATITQGNTVTVYAQVYEPGVTEAAGQGAGITAQIGYSTTNTTPDGTWTWATATFNVQDGNNDEYQADLGTGLTPGTYYYASRFVKASSASGTYVYGGTNGSPWATSGVLTVNGLGTPVATAATVVGSTTFTANWDAVTDATSYRLDVSTSPTFGTLSTGSTNEGFETGLATSYNASPVTTTLSSGDWTLTNVIRTTTNVNSGTYAAQLKTNNEGVMVSPSIGGMSTVTFFAKRNGTSGNSGIAVYKIVNSVETLMENIILPPGSFAQYTININESSSLDVKFKIVNTGGNVANIDDVVINYSLNMPSYVSGYENLNVGNVASYEVTGLNPETTYYYRVRAILGANTSANSNEIEVATTAALVSVTWDGSAWSNVDGPDAALEAVLEGAYATSTEGGFTAKKLTVATGGSLTIAAETSVTVVNELVNELTATAVVIESNGSLIQNGTSNNNTGNVTVKRNTQDLMRLDYTLWSSPVDVQNLGGFSPLTMANRFYTYTTATNIYAAIAKTNDFAVGQGYLIRTPDNHPTSPTAWEGNFIGKPNSGTITFGLSTAGTGFNLVGNPYPSPISIATFLSENSGVISGNLYFWRKTNAAAGSAYVTYSGGTFSDGAHAFDNIQPGQGFIVEATATNDLTFANTQRAAGNGVFYRNGNTMQSGDNSRIWLNLTSNNAIVGQMAVGYRADATNEIDAFDANYFNDSSVTTVALNSIVATTELAVQHRAAFEPTDVVALSFKTNTAGNYSIAINTVDGLFDNVSQTIFLKDNLLNIEHNLRTAPYSFTSEVGTFNSRFEVIYQSTLSFSNPTLANDVMVYTQNNSIEIKTATEQIAAVKVYDLKGSLIANVSNVNTTSVSIPLSNVANQVLVVQVTTQNGATVARKVVR